MNFDWEYYIHKYKDLIPAGINNEQRALDHWNSYGQYEGRRYVPDNEILFIIITTKLIKSIAINLQHVLSKMHIKSLIKYTLSDYDITNTNSNDKYVILYNSRSDLKLPNVYIWYQVEQTNSIYFNIPALRASKIIWDFSIKNYNKYNQSLLHKLYYMPLPFYCNETDIIHTTPYIYDIFFYGTYNDRRAAILNVLKSKYNIKIGFGVVEDERDGYIKSSKIIINLHYYDNAAIETARFNEVLKFGKLIISETSLHKHDYYNLDLYKDMVVFIDNIKDDLSNIDQLYTILDNYLNNQSIYDSKIQSIATNKYILMDHSVYFTKRNLLSVLDFGSVDVKINYELNTDTIYCVHFPETPLRYDLFITQPNYNNIVNKIKFYPAIKCSPHLNGCKFSYINLILNSQKFTFSYINLIHNAQRRNLPQITICQDDCWFNSDFDIKYSIVLEFLNKIGSWDIFVGVLSDLPEDTILTNLYSYKNMTFIEIKKMHSTGFNIYNNTCFNEILKWKISSGYTNINQYIKKCDFRIIIPILFEFSHLDIEPTISGETILNKRNVLFENSNTIINNLIQNYLKVNIPIIIQ
jgi:hypothetical protein